MDIAKIRRDLKTISEGKWVDNIPNAGALRLHVRGMDAPEVREYRSQLERAVSQEDRNEDGSIKGQKALEILGQTLHEKVLINWDGLTDNGNPVAYNPALAKAWLTNPEFEDFGNAVVWAAHSVDRSRIQTQQAVEGN